jgi:leader peptidase (prepilin peptidase) / N-methyltransferase
MTIALPLLLFAGGVAGLVIDAASFCYARNPGWSMRQPSALASAAVGAAAFAAAGLAPSGELIVFSVLLAGLLLALANIDLRTFLLPDLLNVAVLGLGALMVALLSPEDWAQHAIGAAAGYGVLWAVEVFYRYVRGRDGLGRGDAKLLGAIGMWTGWMGLPAVLLVASLSGILAVVVQSAIRKEAVAGQTAIAFGPWIALGGYAVWLGGLILP